MKSHAEAIAILTGKPAPASSAAGSALTPRRSSAATSPPPSSLPGVYRAVDAVVIGIDPGSHSSGWAISVRDRLVGFGQIAKLDSEQIDAVIRSAATFAELEGATRGDGAALRVVLVLEKPPPANVVYEGRTPDAVASVFAARGAWRNAWLRAGYSPRTCVGVYVSTWRAAVLGRGWGGGKKRESIVDRELLIAGTMARAAGLTRELGPDACAAVLITSWGVRAAAVHKAIERKARVGSRTRGKGKPKTAAVAEEGGVAR